MIGDNLQTDIMGALGCGIDAMLFNRWGVEVEKESQKPTYVVNQLKAIMAIL
jgi:ribonucleotide monophosphatase NagD (HAD superfamily)